MEGHTGVWLLAALLVAALISAEAQNTNTPSYFEVGGELVLKPEQVSGRITSIAWKLKGDMVGEWAEGTLDLEFTPRFKGRSSMDTTTGELKISSMTMADAGLYTVDVNNNVQDGGYDAKAIKQVPEPKVIVRPLTCNKESDRCLLSCHGDITEAGPVTFYFKMGDGEWEEGKQDMDITNNETIQAVPTFSCRMKNPLGEKDSEPLDNLFYVASNTGAIVGSVIGVLAIIAVGVGVGVWLYRKKRKTYSTNGTSNNTATSPQDNGSKADETLLQETNLGSSDPA